MRSYNSLSIYIVALLCIVSAAPAEQTSVTLLGVIPSDFVDPYTQSRSSTTETSTAESLPTLSTSLDITPIGTAAGGSETTYSFREIEDFVGLEFTIDGVRVQSASGYRQMVSQVFEPSSTNTVTMDIPSVNCTFNGDGDGVCLETKAGDPTSTFTYTGTVIPVVTAVFDVDSNGVGTRPEAVGKTWLVVSFVAVALMLVPFY